MKENKAEEEKAEEEKIKMTAGEKREMRRTARRVFLDPSSPPVRSIIRVVIISMLVVAVFDFTKSLLSSLTKLFFIIVLAIFFAYLIDPLVKIIRHPFKVRHLEKFMPRSLAIVIAYIFVFTILGVAIANLTPVISKQARDFSVSLPEYTASIQEKINQLNVRFNRMKISEDLQNSISSKTSAYIGEAATSAGSLLTSLPWLILIPILAFFFLKDVNVYRISLLRLVPSGKWRARVESVLFDVNKTLAAYARAQLISCVLIGVICTIGFYLLGLDYALLLGILAGVFEFVPLIGPLTIAIAAVGLSFLESPWLALYVAIFLLILRLTHDYVTYPRIVRQSIHLHPLAIIFSVLAGEQVAGIAGVFISIPVVALLTVLYKHILEHRAASGVFEGWFEPKDEEKKIIENI
ncbi:MAG: AI-2E family transporter [Pyrinomonadaceae bacterium]